jgi:polyisoprenoid-binding protein YceI
MLTILSRPLALGNVLILGAALALVQQPVWAQIAPAYQVDTGASRVYVKVGSATRLGHVHGVEGRLASGKVTPGGAGELVFDMKSFVADTAAARQYVGLPASFSGSDAQKVTANMQSGDVLDVNRFPQATYTITAMEPIANQKPCEPGAYRFTGKFTLHGVTQAVAFQASVEQTARPGVLHVRGSFAILQTAYGVQPYSALGGLVGVTDRLEIWGDLLLVPADH